MMPAVSRDDGDRCHSFAMELPGAMATCSSAGGLRPSRRSNVEHALRVVEWQDTPARFE